MAGSQTAKRLRPASHSPPISAGRESPLALHRARTAVPPPADAAQWRALRSQAIAAAMEQRVPGWRARVQAGAPQR